MGTASTQGPLWGARPRDWSTLQEPLHEPLYKDVWARAQLGTSTRLLDVGCGSGRALELATAMGASASGIDAAEMLIAVAKERLAKADLRVGDIEELPFADQSFDVVSGFNAFQYAGTPLHALQEAKRVLRSGGTLVIATWAPAAETQASSLIMALKPLLPAPPPGAPGPFALSDEAALRDLVQRAGLSPVSVHDVECPFHYRDLAIGVRALDSAGVSAKAAAHSGQAAVSAAHEAALKPFVKADGTVFVQNKFRYLIASS